ncbi:hypothetical protein MRX96_035173 [Rhipicephalus microplus]
MAEKSRVAAAPTGDTLQMAAFIEQEADEKVEEINTKAEEEFNVEKMRLVREQCAKYLVEWNAKKKKSDRIRKVDNSSTKSKGRLVLLQAMNDHVARVVNETRKEPRGLYRLLDKDVVLSCRKKDEPLVRACHPGGRQAVPQEDRHTGRTWAARRWSTRSPRVLELIAQHTVPEIRAALFGANKHRKYTS